MSNPNRIKRKRGGDHLESESKDQGSFKIRHLGAMNKKRSAGEACGALGGVRARVLALKANETRDEVPGARAPASIADCRALR